MPPEALKLFFFPFLIAGLASLALTPMVRWLAGTLGVVCRPKADRWHRSSVPLLGGAALWLSVVSACAAAAALGTEVPLVLLAAGTAMFVLGLVDDVRPVRPSTKLVGQIAVACAFLLIAPPAVWMGSAPGVLVAILWFVAITNAFNLLDNMDGLSVGIAVIAAISLAVTTGGANPELVVVCAALAGAGSAFLVYNFNPASIFMGDSGSLFLGFTLAAAAALASSSAPSAPARLVWTMAVPAVVMLVPIFDTIFVTISRKLSARAASTGGRDHTSHRLVALGFSERQAVLLCYGLAASAGAAAYLLGRDDIPEAKGLAALMVVAFVLLGVRLARVKVYDGSDFRVLRDARYTPLLLDVTYKRRIFEVLLDLGLFVVAYYLAYVIRFDDEFPIYQDLFLKSLPVVIAAQFLSFYAAGVYRGVWQYITVSDLSTYVKGLMLGTLSSILLLVYIYRFEGFSRGVFIINVMTAGLLVVGTRVSFRLLGDIASRYRPARRRALILGAGDGGAMVVRELRNNLQYDCRPVAFVDDNRSKHRRRIMGIPVLGGLEDLEQLIVEQRADLLILSTGKIPPARMEAVRQVCFNSGTTLVQLRFSLDPVPGSETARRQ